MATTIEPTTTSAAVPPPPGLPAEPDSVALRQALVGELVASAAAMRAAVAVASSASASAVHEVRRALRRARAVLALVARLLPKADRRAARKGLQEARRALAGLRDLAIAPETFAGLELDDVQRGAAASVLAAAARTAPTGAALEQVLAEAAGRAAAQIDGVLAALPAEIEWSDVIAGVRATYRDARDARRGAKHGRRAFRRWRHRSQELACQLELLARHGSSYAEELRAAVAAASDAGRPAADLLAIRELVRAHRDASEADALAEVRASIAAQLREGIREARRAGRDAFRAKPRKVGAQCSISARTRFMRSSRRWTRSGSVTR